jgi:ferrous iron transport protein A
MAPEGRMVRIIEVKAGSRAMFRLAELGLTPNSVVRVLKTFGSGPILLDVKGSRIALGRGIAMRVFVEVL